MTNTALLIEEIERSGLKRAHLAARLNLSRSGFWRKVTGKSPFNQYEIRELCDALGIYSAEKVQAIFFA